MKRIAGAFVIALMGVLSAHAQESAPVKYLSLGTLNPTSVRVGRTVLRDLLLVNTTTTLYYLKLYNKVGGVAPVCGTDIPLWTIPIPFGASNSGGGAAVLTSGLLFPNGLGFCITGGIADNDTSNAATGLVINFGLGQ